MKETQAQDVVQTVQQLSVFYMKKQHLKLRYGQQSSFTIMGINIQVHKGR